MFCRRWNRRKSHLQRDKTYRQNLLAQILSFEEDQVTEVAMFFLSFSFFFFIATILIKRNFFIIEAMVKEVQLKIERNVFPQTI